MNSIHPPRETSSRKPESAARSSKPRILIVYPPNAGGRRGPKAIYYPLGVGYIASVLRKNYEISVYDFNFDYSLGRYSDKKYIKEILRNFDYDVLLIGGVFPKKSALKDIIEVSRSLTSAKIIIGGSHIKENIDVLPNYLNADYYVVGEGERTIHHLMSNLSAGQTVNDVHGIAYHNGSDVVITPPASPISDLDDVPFPARDLSNFDVYKRYFALGMPLGYTAHIIASRGCPFNCTFCNPAFGRKANVRSSGNILEEIKSLQSDYGIHYFHIHDEMLLGGKKQNLMDFSEAILGSSIPKFSWGGTINHQLLDNDTLTTMRRAGCIRLSFGVESGSVTMLREMRKKHNLEKLKTIVAHCHGIGIEIDFSLLTNTFGETTDTLDETRDYLKSLAEYFFRIIPEIHFITPIPGTDIYDEAKRRGLVNQDDLKNLLRLDDGSRFALLDNLTEMDADFFVRYVAGVNKDVLGNYFKSHPLQYVLTKFGNLSHFRLDESLRVLLSGHLKPGLEGLLWALSRGEISNVPGRLYESIIYATAPNGGITSVISQGSLSAHGGLAPS